MNRAEKKLTVKYGLLTGAYWLLAAVGMAFITPLLEAKGFSSVQIGWLNFTKYLSMMVFQVWIAAFCDRNAGKIPLQWPLEILAAVSVVTAAVFWFSDNHFFRAVIVFILFGATVNCLEPLVNSLSGQYMNHGQNMNYTVARSGGSFTWAFACVGIGMFADAYGTNNILLLQVGAGILFLVMCFFMDPVDFSKETVPVRETESEETRREDSVVHSSWYLIRNYPKYTLFMLGCMAIFMGYNLNETFIIDLIERHGGSQSDLGIAQFVLAMSEVPVMLFYYRIRKRISIDRMMVICAVFCTLRTAATTFAPNVTLLILAQGFELFGLSIYYAAELFFVMDNLPSADVVKGVSLISVAANGVGQAFASAVCGMIREHLGLDMLLYISIAVSFVGVLIMAAMQKAPRERKKTYAK